MDDHWQLVSEAVAAEADAQRALLAGRPAAEGFARAAALYRASYEAAPPGSYGRLVGLLKAAILAGDASDAAAYALAAIDDEHASPVAAYAFALAQMVRGDDASAIWACETMRAAGGALERTARAIEQLARRSRPGYAKALDAIVADFAQRDEHLTGVAIADTAVMLERLAARRGMAVAPSSPLLPGR